MTDNVCDNCGQALQPGGSVVFTPTDGDANQKHLCMSCFEKTGDSTQK